MAMVSVVVVGDGRTIVFELGASNDAWRLRLRARNARLTHLGVAIPAVGRDRDVPLLPYSQPVYASDGAIHVPFTYTGYPAFKGLR
jgi:hypothetical protein